ncbi:hypothetical protein [Exiguobacterium aurantiacum]|uniref:Uncharacterized protein n=1 Tax=Exiguobacterium aurantiacum TaxID=33987 RepID=A0A377FSB7_9BACL|nr:hypothetical protein [Exiguobacterium aurantiacum]STO07365.1 Uncharacterised protein [Exiguobacterium aurantiacum]
MDRQQVEYVERENAFLREQLQALTDQIEAVKQDVLEEGAKHIRGKENTIQKMKELEREVRQAKANADKWRKVAASEKAKRETVETELKRIQQIVERAKAIPVAGKLVAKIEREGQSS